VSDIFVINGGKKLKGEVRCSGFKNAALPILAATIVIEGDLKITNLPRISDVEQFLAILKSLGATVQENSTSEIIINTDNLQPVSNLNHEGIAQMRAAILFLGPLLARFGEVKMPFPGGCVLGKRSVATHLSAFADLGADILEQKDYLHLRVNPNKTPAKTVVLSEMSVTATENVLIYAAYQEQTTAIRLAAVEPHVINLVDFLINAGATIANRGSHSLKVTGARLRSAKIKIIPDMLEAGAFIIAGIMTGGQIKVLDVPLEALDIFFLKLREIGAQFEIDTVNNTVEVLPRQKPLKCTNLKTAVFPGFPTDLMPPFVALLTQCAGISRLFETLFEGRFAFLVELEKLGAQIEILNPHQALVIGPSKLVGTRAASQDIRAGAAVVIAALAASGRSEISNVNYIFRGYENIVQKLTSLGADIYFQKA
jgi:UDP-N-acetylglucosamine 1-carboxyvinyltransferase